MCDSCVAGLFLRFLTVRPGPVSGVSDGLWEPVLIVSLDSAFGRNIVFLNMAYFALNESTN